MKCMFCSAPLPQNGLVCEYCGKRNPLNLSSLSLKDRFRGYFNCPVCEATLERVDIGKKERLIAHHCIKCDGIFFEKDELEKVLESYSDKIYSIDIEALKFVTNHPRHEIEKKVFYRRCPVCKKVMQRKNYKSVSGVIIDRCIKHGVWLDGGELKQLLEWKRAGGEIKASLVKKTDKSVLSKDSYKGSYESGSSLFDFDPIGDFFRWIYGF